VISTSLLCIHSEVCTIAQNVLAWLIVGFVHAGILQGFPGCRYALFADTIIRIQIM
jgi:hypothetical protein